MFSFGSGSFYDGTDAVEVLESDDGSAIPVNMKFTSLVILDKKKALSHLSSLQCIEKAVKLRELLLALEDQGEAHICLSLHACEASYIYHIEPKCMYAPSGERWLFSSYRRFG